MKICVAQTKPVRGDIERNIARHQKLINVAVSHGAEAIIFPELSLTGYEPSLAKFLATRPEDNRLDALQKLADLHRLTIGAGIPLKTDAHSSISMIVFRPERTREVYSKKYLHPDEEEFFGIGPTTVHAIGSNNEMALAICYEINIPEHAEHAADNKAGIYVASVAKTAKGVEKAAETLSSIAIRHSMTVLMANCIGPSGDGDCAGSSAVWNKEGVLLGRLGDSKEGILVLDTDTQNVVEKIL